jgi:hypothetical protein
LKFSSVFLDAQATYSLQQLFCRLWKGGPASTFQSKLAQNNPAFLLKLNLPRNLSASSCVERIQAAVNNSSSTPELHQTVSAPDVPAPAWVNAIALLVWLAACVVAFIPFALNTSPWDAVTFRVPGNQGNWWHALVGAPFFLAFPMVWLRLRALFAARPTTFAARRLLWIVAGMSTAGTILVETPFLLHLAGTSEWQRLSVLSLGFGIVIASALILLLRRHRLAPTQACLLALDTAYLANAALCLVVYAGEPGTLWSKSGWLVTGVIVWPIALELIWIFFQGFQPRPENLSV